MCGEEDWLWGGGGEDNRPMVTGSSREEKGLDCGSIWFFQCLKLIVGKMVARVECDCGKNNGNPMWHAD